MRKERTLFIIGLWVAFLPYLGFYDSWRRTLFFITGLLIIYISYLLYKESKARAIKNELRTKSFVDNITSGE